MSPNHYGDFVQLRVAMSGSVRETLTELYSQLVRALAVLILVAFTVLVSVDKICCPDGCTDSRSDTPVSTESSPHHVTHTCVLCVGVDAPILLLPVKPFTARSPVAAVLTPSLPIGAPARVDHPPRVI
jgi:hypothetical protein